MTPKWLRFLSRFRGEEARKATRADLTQCILMVTDFLVESGHVDEHEVGDPVFERAAEHLAGTMDVGTVLVVGNGDGLRGMVCASLLEPEVATGERYLHCWFLYVKPEYRRKPDTVNALIRGAIALSRELGGTGLTAVAESDIYKRYIEALGGQVRAYHLELKTGG